MLNFWTKLNKPIFALAPMEEVTDVAFREMFARFGKPDVMFTEFVNVDGLLHPEGYKKLSIDLSFTNIQRPMVAQIWGNDPEKFFRAAQLIVKLGFDGIDINMGCPQDKEIGIGACAALIREPELAKKIIQSTIDGARSAGPRPAFNHEAGRGPALQHPNDDIPVSVKTRLGYSKTDEMGEWVRTLLSTNISALTIHARTKQEKSKVPAHWEKIAEAVKLRDGLKSQTLIIGNGDVKNRADGLEKIKQTGCDGIMIGRGAFGNPWLFRDSENRPSIKERLSVMLEHARLFNQLLGTYKPFVIMRKHFKAYVSGFDGAAELRTKLMETKNLEETEKIVGEYLFRSTD